MKHLTKNSLSGESILERFRKVKGETSGITLSDKVMEITSAGAPVSHTNTCIFCDTRDYCTTCDAVDILCIGWDDNDWCITSDSCDIIEDYIDIMY